MTNSGENAYELTVKPDLMSVLAAVDTNCISITEAASAIVKDACGRGISGVPDEQTLAERMQDAEQKDGVIRDFEICRGTPPVPSQDGSIQWAREFFSREFVKDDYGRVDYRRSKGDPAVHNGELLATLHPPKPGSDGVDVFGQSVYAAQPKVASLKPGSDVKTQQQGDVTHFYAAKDGRIRYGNDTVDIDDEYVLKSDVSAKTGDVCHPGSAIVYGDVATGSVVKAEGDLEVYGTIEQADIEVGGSLWVKEGISQHGKSPIKVGGKVVARHLRDTTVEAGEDVEVANEIFNCEILSRGHVSISNGRCTGGVITALKGATVKELGSHGNVVTTLKVAVDPFLDERTSPLKKRVASNQKQIDKIYKKAGPQLEHQRHLTAKQREAVTELLAKVSELQMEIDDTQKEETVLVEESENRARQCKTDILGTVYPEVYIQLGHFRHMLRVTEQLTGPLTVVQTYDEDQTRISTSEMITERRDYDREYEQN